MGPPSTDVQRIISDPGNSHDSIPKADTPASDFSPPVRRAECKKMQNSAPLDTFSQASPRKNLCAFVIHPTRFESGRPHGGTAPILSLVVDSSELNSASA
jgi:hypothetical protein